MSPTWSACRCDKNTLVVAVTGSPSPLKFASEPEPRSKKKKSPSTLPTSMSSDADAWLFFTNGSPLPRIVTRISSTASGSVPGTKTSAYCRAGVPTTGVVVTGSREPSYASSVISLISVAMSAPPSSIGRGPLRSPSGSMYDGPDAQAPIRTANERRIAGSESRPRLEQRYIQRPPPAHNSRAVTRAPAPADHSATAQVPHHVISVPTRRSGATPVHAYSR